MNFNTRLIIGVLVVAGLIYFQIPKENLRNSLTNPDIEGIITTVEAAFDGAEHEKCVCKRTGEMVHFH